MKIVIGKFSNEPFHALSKKEVTLILKLVPKEWISPISSVVLSAKIFKKTKLAKPIEYNGTTNQLSIYSRGLEREDIAKQMFMELAGINAQLEDDNAVSTAYLEAVIKPYMVKFLKARV